MAVKSFLGLLMLWFCLLRLTNLPTSEHHCASRGNGWNWGVVMVSEKWSCHFPVQNFKIMMSPFKNLVKKGERRWKSQSFRRDCSAMQGHCGLRLFFNHSKVGVHDFKKNKSLFKSLFRSSFLDTFGLSSWKIFRKLIWSKNVVGTWKVLCVLETLDSFVFQKQGTVMIREGPKSKEGHSEIFSGCK